MLNEKVIGEYVYQVSDECKVGVGLFRHVYKRYNEKTKKQEVIKRIDKKQSKGIFEQMLSNQINILKQLNFQYILKMHAYYETTNYYYIITEFCETEILQIIKQQGCLPENTLITYILLIGRTLKYLNSKKIILSHPISQSMMEKLDWLIGQANIKTKMEFQIGFIAQISRIAAKNEYNYKQTYGPLVLCFFEMIIGIHSYIPWKLYPLFNRNRFNQKIAKISKGLYLDVQTSTLN